MTQESVLSYFESGLHNTVVCRSLVRPTAMAAPTVPRKPPTITSWTDNLPEADELPEDEDDVVVMFIQKS
jgi:hypothetical protein